MTRQETRSLLIELIEPALEGMGYELLRLDYVTGKHGHLNLFIDSEHGIGIEDCETVSRAVSGLLDMHDPIAHAYTLEVSSPGIERPLSKKEHFRKYIGEKVKLRTNTAINGNRKFSGQIINVAEENLEILQGNGEKTFIPFSLIERANLWFTNQEIERMAKLNNERGRAKADE